MLHFYVNIHKFLALIITIWTSSGHHCHYLEPWIMFLLTDCLASDVTHTLTTYSTIWTCDTWKC